MASLVFCSFSFPLQHASEIITKLKLNYLSSPCQLPHQEKTSFRNVLNQSSLANEKSVELASLSHASRSVYSMTSQDMLLSRFRLPGFASCIFIRDQNVQTVISGYWSGPDFEDGWGFVEAYVDQTKLFN